MVYQLVLRGRRFTALLRLRLTPFQQFGDANQHYPLLQRQWLPPPPPPTGFRIKYMLPDNSVRTTYRGNTSLDIQSQAHREPTVPYPGFDYPPPNNPSTGSHPLRPDVNPFPPVWIRIVTKAYVLPALQRRHNKPFLQVGATMDCPPAFRLVPGMA